MKFEEGQIVKHKASGQRMVILNNGYKDVSFECRYLNGSTGEYCTLRFKAIELLPVKKEV